MTRRTLILVLFGSLLTVSASAERLWQGVDPTDETYLFGWRVAPAGDVNGDGVPDLLVGDGDPSLPLSLHLYLGECEGTFTGPVSTIEGPELSGPAPISWTG